MTENYEKVKEDEELPAMIPLRNRAASIITENDLTLGPALKKISSLATFPIIGMLCHPLHHLINVSLMGRDPNPKYLAGLGLGAMLIGIALLSVSLSFVGALDTLAS